MQLSDSHPQHSEQTPYLEIIKTEYIKNVLICRATSDDMCGFYKVPPDVRAW